MALSLDAQNLKHTPRYTVSCRSIVDGVVVAEGESQGALKSVRCEYTIRLPTPGGDSSGV